MNPNSCSIITILILFRDFSRLYQFWNIITTDRVEANDTQFDFESSWIGNKSSLAKKEECF